MNLNLLKMLKHYLNLSVVHSEADFCKAVALLPELVTAHFELRLSAISIFKIFNMTSPGREGKIEHVRVCMSREYVKTWRV